MHFLPQPLRGPAFMVAATAAYVTNDTLMKLATVGLPPLQVLFLRGICATIWCLPVVLMLGHGRDIAFILASGLTIVLLDNRKRRLTVVA